MRVYDILIKKRDGEELSREEIFFLIQGYHRGEIADYQMAAFLMAVYFSGMSSQEAFDLTFSLLNSGITINLKEMEGSKVDKHSTGGVGDKISLILVPLVAAAGLYVPMISGRSLGHTGGTLDKLESIPGFRTQLNSKEFVRNLRQVGAAIIAQSEEIVPVEGKLYALRDVTATIESIPLITASIMSKKLAAGADALVLDVKTGSGAFMKTYEDARMLARNLLDVCTRMRKEAVALITDMDQPLGRAVGNSLEVREAIATLRGEGPEDIVELTIQLSAYMLKLGKKVDNLQEGKRMLMDLLRKGEALRKFQKIIAAQGGDPRVVENQDFLPKSGKVAAIFSAQEGYVKKVDALQVGRAAMVLGASRVKIGEPIDPGTGIVLEKKAGDLVLMGEKLASLHYNTENQFSRARELLYSAFQIVNEKPPIRSLIHDIIKQHN